MAHAPRPAGPAPTRAALHEAALRHIARFACTEASLVRVLERRVHRWAQRAAAEGIDVQEAQQQGRQDAREVAAALSAAGIVNDAIFGAARAARLARAGRSNRTAKAHLLTKGLAPVLVAALLPDGRDELPTALAYAKRRRLGPFRPTGGEGQHQKDMAALARAGFSRETAERALTMPSDEADALVTELKRG